MSRFVPLRQQASTPVGATPFEQAVRNLFVEADPAQSELTASQQQTVATSIGRTAITTICSSFADQFA